MPDLSLSAERSSVSTIMHIDWPYFWRTVVFA
jgi:hypothetical protein